jgi:hypothetical protein
VHGATPIEASWAAANLDPIRSIVCADIFAGFKTTSGPVLPTRIQHRPLYNNGRQLPSLPTIIDILFEVLLYAGWGVWGGV